MSLAALQQAMSGYLINAPGNDFTALMSDAPGLAVYHNNYRFQLLDCLRDTYEKCWAWLGDDVFDSAANAHIDQHPPSSWTLDAYGHDFGQTLSALHPDDPEVAELAWIEWAMRRAFDGPDAAPIDPASLADVDWDRAHFDMTPTLKLATMTTNAAAIWSALAGEENPPAIGILAAPATLCVWRHDLSPCFRTIDDVEARMMRLALDGVSFGNMCFLLTAELGGDDAATAAGAVLAQWLRDGMITKLC